MPNTRRTRVSLPLEARAIINDERVDSYIAQQESEALRSIAQLPALKQEYERFLLLQLFDFRPLLYQQETMVRIFAEYFYHSHAALKQLHDRTLMDLRQRIIEVASKWQQMIRTMPVDDLRDEKFFERVKRSADYFATTLKDILTKPIQLSEKVETNNKQAKKRLANALPELQQTWLARRYLLTRIAEQGFTISIYLKEKQMSALDALEENTPKRGSKPRKTKKKNRK